MCTLLILLQLFFFCALAYRPGGHGYSRSIPKSSWQEDFDRLVDVDNNWEGRQEELMKLSTKLETIQRDLQKAIRSGDVTIIAPLDQKYGKDLKGLKEFKQQLRYDIIPSVLFQGIPQLLSIGPGVLYNTLKSPDVSNFLPLDDAVQKIGESIQDPSVLQANIEDIKVGLKNVIKSTPEGLDAPRYEVKKSTTEYEIREYAPYGVVTCKMDDQFHGTSAKSGITDNNLFINSIAFNLLTKYMLGGANDQKEKLAMTIPVIMADGKMSLVLGNNLTTKTAPKPNNERLRVEDMTKEFLAVREFTGVMTDKESAKQRALLEDALLADGVIFDNLSFKMFQYNPPYALPWVRRNEISLKVDWCGERNWDRSGEQRTRRTS